MAASGLGGNPPPRPDQVFRPPRQVVGPGTAAGVFRGRLVIITGSANGLFIYNAAGTVLEYSAVGATTTDPLLGQVVLAGETSYSPGGVTNLNGAVTFIYVPAPGAGKLAESIAPVGGTDLSGNTYLAGFAAYNNAAGVYGQLTNGVLNLGAFTDTTPGAIGASGGRMTLVAGNRDITDEAPQLFLISKDALGGTGVPNAVFSTGNFDMQVGINGGFSSNSPLEVQGITGISDPIIQAIARAAGDNGIGVRVFSDAFNRFAVDSNAVISLGTGAAARDTNLYRGAANLLQTDDEFNWTSPGGTVLGAPGALLASVTVNTVTSTSISNLTQQTIPANDGVIGATYKLTAFGRGTQGLTQQILNMFLRIAGTTVASIAFPATFMPANATFEWDAECILTYVTTGAGGTVNGKIRVNVSQFALGNATSAMVGTNGPTPVADNTTTASVLQLAASWGSTTGAPTISKTTGQYEKIS